MQKNGNAQSFHALLIDLGSSHETDVRGRSFCKVIGGNYASVEQLESFLTRNLEDQKDFDAQANDWWSAILTMKLIFKKSKSLFERTDGDTEDAGPMGEGLNFIEQLVLTAAREGKDGENQKNAHSFIKLIQEKLGKTLEPRPYVKLLASFVGVSAMVLSACSPQSTGARGGARSAWRLGIAIKAS